MNNPMLTIIDCLTGETTTREMTEQEFSDLYAEPAQTETKSLIPESPDETPRAD
jgi:hypothetical protein